MTPEQMAILAGILPSSKTSTEPMPDIAREMAILAGIMPSPMRKAELVESEKKYGQDVSETAVEEVDEIDDVVSEEFVIEDMVEDVVMPADPTNDDPTLPQWSLDLYGACKALTSPGADVRSLLGQIKQIVAVAENALHHRNL